MIFGWGGFGGYGNAGAQGVQDGYILASDFSNIERKIDTVNSGLCDGFYAMNTGMLNGFSGVNTNIMQGTNALQSAISNLGAQNQACCCELQRQIERGFADTNYNIATQSCDIKQAIADSSRSILDFLTQDKIATLTAENQSLKFSASQVAQNGLLTNAMNAQTAQLINAINPAPVPAYVVANPNAAYSPCGCSGC